MSSHPKEQSPHPTNQLNETALVRIVLNTLPSPHSKRSYLRAIRDFLNYWRSQDEPELNKSFLQFYIAHMQEQGVGEASINQRLAAIRKLASEAAECSIWSDKVPAAFAKVKNISQRGKRIGNWLSLEQAQLLINTPNTSTRVGIRDRAMLAILFGCGLRRQELVNLSVQHLQLREGRWVIANLVGKRNKSRTITLPTWAKQAVDACLHATDITHGRVFQAMSKSGKILRDCIHPETVRDVVKKYASRCGFGEIAPHDLRRSYAKLAYKNGAPLDQIQINLGHKSLSTTEIYIGADLNLEKGPGDYLNISLGYLQYPPAPNTRAGFSPALF